MKNNIMFIILILLSILIANDNVDYSFKLEEQCPIDNITNLLSPNNLENLIEQRIYVNNNINANINSRSILSVPVVFHNLYKIIDNQPVASYCDYNGGTSTNNFEYTSINNQEICNQRMFRSLDVLNANYSTAFIEFVLHPDYPEMLHATDPGFDGFYERATGGTETSPSSGALKDHYNIPNALNIYVVDFVNTRDGTQGIATYPWSAGTLGGIFIKHGQMPGDSDVQSTAEYARTLMHEIGHYFSLLHINGVWYLMQGNTPRDLVNGTDCNEKGDFICDTPAEPGMTNNGWYTNSSTRECIYYGYNGEYSTNDHILKIGGKNQTFYSGYYPFYNYCNEWNIEDPYNLDHCQLFTNYDNIGDFFGTKDLPESCFNDEQTYFASECDANYYINLPIGYNFLRAGGFPYNNCGFSPIDDNIYYDETKQGFTLEQSANIEYSLKEDYMGCTNQLSENYSEYILVNSGECIFNGYMAGDINQNNIINIIDIMLVINYILDVNTFTEFEFQLADCNANDDINITDVVMIIQFIVTE